MEDQFQKEIDSGEMKKREIKGRRAHERKIGIIIEKVALWRKLYTGLNLNGMTIQLNLEVAAQKVDLSKKTLDDYLYQIRFFLIINFTLLFFCKDWGKKMALILTQI